MNNKVKNYFEEALKTTIQFGNRRSANAICITNAVIIKRNFEGLDIPCKKKKDGRSFVKQGRRFTWVLTEDMFNALCQEKGECSYGIWQFDQENPDLKVYTIEVRIKMESANPPVCRLYTKHNGKADVNLLTSTNLSVLDKISDCDIERIDMTLNAYDPEQSGHFTLWLRDFKLSQIKVEDSDGYDDYWDKYSINDEDLPWNVDPNTEQVNED